MKDETPVRSKTIQFPLSLLAFGKTRQEKLTAMISHAIVSAGNYELGTQARLDDDETIIAGCQFIGSTCNSPQRIRTDNKKAESFVTAFTSRGFKVPFVRIAVNIFWQAQASTMAFQDFAVLCAINAALGSKNRACITKPRIAAGALGYSTWSCLGEAGFAVSANGRRILRDRDDGEQPLSERQTRTILDRLQAQGLFARFQSSPRRTFFSRQLTAEEIGEAEVARLEQIASKSKKISILKARCAELTKQIATNNAATT